MYGFIGASVTINGVQVFQQLKVGSGGLVSHITAADDGSGSGETLVVTTDSYSGYIWNPNATQPQGNAGGIGAWQDLFSSSSMPAAFVENSQGYSHGIFSNIGIAPSNTTIMYAMGLVFPNSNAGTGFPTTGIYKSTNKGVSWTLTSFTPVSTAFAATIGSTDGNNAWRFNGQRIAIHPTNPNICYVGFADIGAAFVTLDGGATWSTVANLPAGSANTQGICCFQFDLNNPNNLYATTSTGTGANGGQYYTTSASTTGASAAWTKIGGSGISGSPNQPAQQSSMSLAGKWYVVDEAGDLWSFIGGTWVEEISTGTMQCVACDPFSSSHVIAQDRNDCIMYENFGSGWGSPSLATNATFSDIPWQVGATGCLSMIFSPTTPNKLYCAGVNDVFTVTLSGPVAGTSVNWISRGVGLEQIIGNAVSCGVSGNPLVGGWDHSAFKSNLTQYPSAILPPAVSGNLAGCWHIDHSKTGNNAFAVMLVDGSQYGNNLQASSFTTDNGVTWTALGASGTTLPSNAYPNGGQGGCVAVSTPSNFIFSQNGGVQPSFTLNQGMTWSLIDLSSFGVTNWSNFQNQSAQHHDVGVVADGSTANTLYLYYSGNGLFKTTNGGTTWTLQTATPPANLIAIMPVPGQPGHLLGWAKNFLGPGTYVPDGSNPSDTPIYFSTDGGATWTVITNVFGPDAMCTGAAAPGQSYPAIYAADCWVGFVSTSALTFGLGSKTITVPTGNTNSFVPGSTVAIMVAGGGHYATGTVTSLVGTTLTFNIDYMSAAQSGSSWVVYSYGTFQTIGGPTATPIWNNLGGFPGGSMDLFNRLAGDPVIFGQIYGSVQASGFKVRM